MSDEQQIKEDAQVDNLETAELVNETPIDNWEQKYLYALADYQNLLKQVAKEKQEVIKYGTQSLLSDLLPVYNNLKTALAHSSGVSDAWLEGVGFVAKQFKEVLTANGVVEIDALGLVFNPQLMEAMSEELTNDENLDGQVAKVVVAGYSLNGRVIEPSKVVVYKLQTEA
jgi:molecular chaperone GrpE